MPTLARRRIAAVLLVVALGGAACGSGSGTETDGDRGVPSGPEDADTTGSTTTPTPYGDPNE